MNGRTIWIGIEVANNLLLLILFLVLLNRKLQAPREWLKDGLFLAVGSVVMLISDLLPVPLTLSLWLYYALFLGFALIYKRGYVYLKVFWVTMTHMIHQVSSHIVMSGFILNLIPFYQVLQPSRGRLVGVLVYALIQTLIFLVFIFRTEHLLSLNHQQLLVFMGMSLVYIGLSSLLQELPANPTMPLESQRLVAYASLLTSASFIGFMLAVNHLAKVFSENQELNELALLKRHEGEFLVAVHEGQEGLKKAQHDYQNQLLILAKMLRRGELAALGEHLVRMADEVAHALVLSTTGYTAVDAIISAKLLAASALDVDVKHSVVLVEGLQGLDADLAIILGNTWDNALAAVQYVPKEKRIIHCAIRCVQGAVVVDLRNSCDGVFEYTSNNRISRRHSGRQAIGLERVKQLAERHGGLASYRIVERNGRYMFEIQVSLQFPEGFREGSGRSEA